MRLPNVRALRGYVPDGVKGLAEKRKEAYERRKRLLEAEIEAWIRRTEGQETELPLRVSAIEELSGAAGEEDHLQRCWFGLSPREVHRYLRKQKNLQETELADLEERLRMLKRNGNGLPAEPSDEERGSEAQVEAAVCEQHGELAVDAAAEDKADLSEQVMQVSDCTVPPSPESGRLEEITAAACPSAVSDAHIQGVGDTVLRTEGGYWGDIGRFLSTPIVRPAAHFAAAASEQTVPPRPAPTHQASEVLQETEVPVSGNQGSPALSEEIRHIRHKYIVGKIAGEDLFDRQGRLIVARHGTITSEIVDQADREGKLADLIVSMVLPGLGESGSS